MNRNFLQISPFCSVHVHTLRHWKSYNQHTNQNTTRYWRTLTVIPLTSFIRKYWDRSLFDRKFPLTVIVVVENFSQLCHLSRKLKWDFLTLNLLFQSHLAKFNKTWHDGSLRERKSILFEWTAMSISKGRYRW